MVLQYFRSNRDTAPEAKASAWSPKRRSHSEPAAEGGAMTSARGSTALSMPGSVTNCVGGSATPSAR